jgi:hypothetical protein
VTIPRVEPPDPELIARLEKFALDFGQSSPAEELSEKKHLAGPPADLRFHLAFFAPQTEGELGPDFKEDDAREAVLKVAERLLDNVPRRIRRNFAHEDKLFLTHLLAFAVSRGLVSGVRWAKGIGVAEAPR